MDFTLSPEQALIRATVRDYCERNYRFPDRQRILRSVAGFSREHWKAYAELGWLGATLPEDVGGCGGSAIDMAIILEEFGRSLVLEPFIPCAVFAAHLVDAAGSAEQRARLLPALVRGELMVAVAHEEDSDRGDEPVVATRASRRSGGHYVCTGRKLLVPGGGCADELIVSARTAGEPHARDGISAFLVPPGARGLWRRAFRTLDGGDAAELVLDGVELDSAALLGPEGGALPALEDATDWAIVGLCAEAVGAIGTVVTSTAEFLKARRAYGTTLSTFQALQHRIADMLVESELSRSILYRALGALMSADRPTRRRTVAAAKALIGRSGRFVGSNGIQLHGGMGMSDDFTIGHLFKRLTVIERLFGSSDAHLNRLASTAEAEGEPTAHQHVESHVSQLTQEEVRQ